MISSVRVCDCFLWHIEKHRSVWWCHSLRELIPGHLQGNFQEIPYKCPVCCPKPGETDRTIKANLLSVRRRFSSLFAIWKLLWAPFLRDPKLLPMPLGMQEDLNFLYILSHAGRQLQKGDGKKTLQVWEGLEAWMQQPAKTGQSGVLAQTPSFSLPAEAGSVGWVFQTCQRNELLGTWHPGDLVRIEYPTLAV